MSVFTYAFGYERTWIVLRIPKRSLFLLLVSLRRKKYNILNELLYAEALTGMSLLNTVR